jgi:hypothetical protein
LPFEVPGRDTPVKELALGLFALAAFKCDDILLGRNRYLVGRETGDRQSDLVTVVSQPFDVVRRITFVSGPWAVSTRSNRRSKPMVDRKRGEKS